MLSTVFKCRQISNFFCVNPLFMPQRHHSEKSYMLHSGLLYFTARSSLDGESSHLQREQKYIVYEKLFFFFLERLWTAVQSKKRPEAKLTAATTKLISLYCHANLKMLISSLVDFHSSSVRRRHPAPTTTSPSTTFDTNCSHHCFQLQN